ncbi:unnamed protein product [Urochloa humidicola]
MGHNADPAALLVVLAATLSLIPLPSAAAQPWRLCDRRAGNYTAGSDFETNLLLLVSTLSANASASPALFASGSSPPGGGGGADTVYGLLLCRGDLTAELCSRCGATAAEDVGQVCAHTRDAALLYDHCYLRVTGGDDYFLSSPNNTGKVSVTSPHHSHRERGTTPRSASRERRSGNGNEGTLASPPCKNQPKTAFLVPRSRPATPSFRELGDYGPHVIPAGVNGGDYVAAVWRLLNATARYAVERSVSAAPAPARRMYFATGQLVGLDPRRVPSIWSAVQCAGDLPLLSPEQCRKCLDGLVAEWWVGGWTTSMPTGKRIAGSRCNLRTEVAQFYTEAPW